MKRLFKICALQAAVSLALVGGIGATQAAVNVQCPGDNDGDAAWKSPGEYPPGAPAGPPANVKCMHLTAGDGFAEMSDGHPVYTFGFSNQTGTPPGSVISNGILDAHWPGSKIELDQGDQLYLSLTNVGTVIRPDLFDPHTVHYHGFPNAATVFDGVPEASISINMGSTLTYYYNVVNPGTYFYHCHVEATEHMEMGMLANLYVHPAQDMVGCSICPKVNDLGMGVTFDSNREREKAGLAPDPTLPRGYAYNDGDGTTAFDVEAPIQVSGFDGNFHDQHVQVQPLPFASLRADYPQINGRGYPDTVLDDVNAYPKGIVDISVPDTVPGSYQDYVANTLQMQPPRNNDGAPWLDVGVDLNNGNVSQNLGARIEVTSGDRLLMRFSNVSIDRFFSLTVPGMKMRVVGTGATLMRNGNKNIYVETASVNFGGGQAEDIIIDTTGVAPGTYFLTATEFYQMSNKTQLDGGLITEIVVNAAPGA